MVEVRFYRCASRLVYSGQYGVNRAPANFFVLDSHKRGPAAREKKWNLALFSSELSYRSLFWYNISMFAIVQIAGKQYKVSIGTKLVVDRLDGKVGDALKFDRVLLL